MRRTSSAVGSLGFVGFVILSLFVGTFGIDKKEIKHPETNNKHHPAGAAAAVHAPPDSKHAAAAAHEHPNVAHAPETKHPIPAVKVTDEANNVYSVCVERDVLPAPDNAPKDKLKTLAAKCDECGQAKCKDKCGGKEVNDACRSCINVHTESVLS
uniref:4Fe-4S ferredoxin-type domain-containing protein n=1 Tax=Globodera pallida TaxID=36090 RepID=A0A183BW92_GLOPA